MIKNEFYELSWNAHGRIVFLTWLPASANMSGNNFMEHIDVINNLIDTNYTRILFIDAVDFKVKIEKSLKKELHCIKEPDSLKWILYAPSDRNIIKLLGVPENKNITINKHATRNELLQIYHELTNN